MKTLVSALITAALTFATIVIGAAPATAAPGDDCPENYFVQQKMWEITWGLQYVDNGTATFNMQSNGGLTELNDGPLPAYMANNPNWHWLYVKEPVQTNSYKYDFADGTIRYANITPDSNGCPAVEWLTFGPPAAQPDPIVDVSTTTTPYECGEDHVTRTTTTTTTAFELDGQNNWVEGTPDTDTASTDVAHAVEACAASDSGGAQSVSDESQVLPDTGATDSLWQLASGTAAVVLGMALVLAARPQRTGKHALLR